MKANITLTFEGLQHVWNVLNRMPLKNRGEITKVRAFYKAAEADVNKFDAYIRETMSPVQILGEKVSDLRKNKDSTAEDRVKANEEYETALAEANKKVEAFARENKSTISIDRESFSFVKSLYEKYIETSYHEEDGQATAGVKGAQDVRRFDETLEALDAVVIE